MAHEMPARPVIADGAVVVDFPWDAAEAAVAALDAGRWAGVPVRAGPAGSIFRTLLVRTRRPSGFRRAATGRGAG